MTDAEHNKVTDTEHDTLTEPADPVLVRRAQLDRLSKRAKRLGYTLYAVAFVVFVFGFVTENTNVTVAVVVASLVIGSVLLAPAIVISYGVKAAVRQERQERQERSQP